MVRVQGSEWVAEPQMIISSTSLLAPRDELPHTPLNYHTRPPFSFLSKDVLSRTD